MELNKIKNNGSWSELAGLLNDNFAKINTQLLKYQDVDAIDGINFVGYVTSVDLLPTPKVASWAVVGADIKEVSVCAYYLEGSVPVNMTAGWNVLSSLGTYDFTDYSNLLTKVEETDAKVSELNVELGNYYTISETDKKFTDTESKLSELGLKVESNIGGSVDISTTEGGSYVSQNLNKPIPKGVKILSFNGYDGKVSFRKQVDESFVSISGASLITEDMLPIVLEEDCTNVQMSIGGKMTISYGGSIVYNINELKEKIDKIEEDVIDVIAANNKFGTNIESISSKLDSVEQSINGVEGGEFTDFSSYERVEGQIINTGKWFFGDYESMLFPLEGGIECTIIASLNRSSYFTFLRNSDNIANNMYADVCDLAEIDGVISNDKRYLIQPNINNTVSFVSPSDCKYLVITTNLSGTDCTPQSISVIGKKGVSDEIKELNVRISRIEEGSSDNPIIEFEQGSIVFDNGNLADSTKYIRCTDFIKSSSTYALFCSKAYIMRVFYYDSNKNYIKYVVANSVYVIDTRYALFKISINNPNGIMPSDNTFFNYVSNSDKTSILARYTDSFNLAENLFYNKSNGRINFINVTDSHGEFESVELGGLVSRYCGNDIIYLNTGDMVKTTPKTANAEDDDVEEYMTLAKKYGIYHCIGQHEVGFQNIGAGYDGKLKANSFTHTEVFDKFIAPMLPLWNLVEESIMRTNKQIYYYKDFDIQKIRLFSLYQFNAPLEDDPSDSSKYKYIRCALWYGQEQIDWFINKLNSTPSGYKVVVMLHEADGILTDNEGWSNFSIKGGSVSATNPIMSEYPVRDIVDAFIAKSTLIKTYQGEQSYDLTNDTADYTKLQLTVNADFSNAKAEFGVYFVGDAHVDRVGEMNSTQKQVGFCTTSPASPSDIVIGVNDKSTFVTGFSISNNFKNVYIGRIGCDTSIYMQDRSKDNFKIT